MEKVRKATEATFWIAGHAEIQMKHLSNTLLDCYCYNSLLRLYYLNNTRQSVQIVSCLLAEMLMSFVSFYLGLSFQLTIDQTGL
jgi:hypothetical protein